MSEVNYMLVMLTSMTEADQITYADAPERFGRDTFTGEMGTCKVVPTNGPELVVSEDQAELYQAFGEIATVLNNFGITTAVTATDIATAVIGKSTAEDLLDPTTYEDAAASHPTTEDAGISPDNYAAAINALASATAPIPS